MAEKLLFKQHKTPDEETAFEILDLGHKKTGVLVKCSLAKASIQQIKAWFILERRNETIKQDRVRIKANGRRSSGITTDKPTGGSSGIVPVDATMEAAGDGTNGTTQDSTKTAGKNVPRPSASVSNGSSSNSSSTPGRDKAKAAPSKAAKPVAVSGASAAVLAPALVDRSAQGKNTWCEKQRARKSLPNPLRDDSGRTGGVRDSGGAPVNTGSSSNSSNIPGRDKAKAAPSKAAKPGVESGTSAAVLAPALVDRSAQGKNTWCEKQRARKSLPNPRRDDSGRTGGVRGSGGGVAPGKSWAAAAMAGSTSAKAPASHPNPPPTASESEKLEAKRGQDFANSGGGEGGVGRKGKRKMQPKAGGKAEGKGGRREHGGREGNIKAFPGHLKSEKVSDTALFSLPRGEKSSVEVLWEVDVKKGGRKFEKTEQWFVSTVDLAKPLGEDTKGRPRFRITYARQGSLPACKSVVVFISNNQLRDELQDDCEDPLMWRKMGEDVASGPGLPLPPAQRSDSGGGVHGSSDEEAEWFDGYGMNYFSRTR